MIKDVNNITKEEVIDILKRYGEQNNSNNIDLSGADLSEYNIDFTQVHTCIVSFDNAKTHDVHFRNATTGSVNFEGATTKNVNFEYATTRAVSFERAKTRYITFRNATTGDFYTNFGKCKYGNKVYDFISLDGITTVYDKPKELFGFTIYEDVREFTYIPFAITNGVFNAHCETIKGAIENLRYKIESFHKDKKPMIAKIKKEGVVSKKDYRELTGACRIGVNNFCNRHNIKTDTLPLSEVLDLFKDKTDYGIQVFLRYMEE